MLNYSVAELRVIYYIGTAIRANGDLPFYTPSSKSFTIQTLYFLSIEASVESLVILLKGQSIIT